MVDMCLYVDMGYSDLCSTNGLNAAVIDKATEGLLSKVQVYNWTKRKKPGAALPTQLSQRVKHHIHRINETK